MKRLPTIALSTAAALVVMASTSGHASAITPHLPVSTSLTTVPDKISWPNSRDFEYRVEMQAGVNGAHFIFTVPAPPWGFKGIYGSPFSFYAEPRLEGPGEIKPSLSIVADPAVFSCWRGSFAGSQFWYEVTLDSGVSTTVVVPGRLEAAPLAGMNSLTDFRMENGDDPILIDAPVAVGGKQGVRIITRMVGKDSKLPAALKSGSKFKLNGFTRPVLINRRIDITARRLTSAPSKGSPDRYRIASVKTDNKGNFHTGTLTIKYPPVKGHPKAIWSFTTKLRAPGNFARGSGCGPAAFFSPRGGRRRSRRPARGRSPEFRSGAVRGRFFRPRLHGFGDRG